MIEGPDAPFRHGGDAEDGPEWEIRGRQDELVCFLCWRISSDERWSWVATTWDQLEKIRDDLLRIVPPYEDPS